MSKFSNMENQIIERLDMPYGPMRLGLSEALAYLDRNPDQVPGRTITRSDYQKLMDDTSMPYGVGFTDGFYQAGGSIIDDPEPTNAEKLELVLEAFDADGDALDLSEYLDAAGVKAPGGHDE